ncbi:hypothetical protein M9458_012419, partial [Cirrhinus mrigala]
IKSFPSSKKNGRRSQLRSRIGTPGNGNVIYRMRTPVPQNISFTPTAAAAWTTSTTPATTTTVTSPASRTTTTPFILSGPAPTTPPPVLPSPSPSMTPWKGERPRVYDVPCDETVCPPDSFCINDYDTGGSRCHCNLGRQGDFCSE